MFRTPFLTFFCFLVISCGQTKDNAVSGELTGDTVQGKVQEPVAPAYHYEVFSVVDSMSVSHGVGYDIYEGEKRIIHQVTIPGEEGIEGFVNTTEAEKVAALVVQKLESGGGFPTVTHEEMAAMGITLQTK